MIQDLLQTFAALHRSVYVGLGQHIADMQASGAGTVLAVVFAFALGLLHAMTPGHGKVVVFSYLVGYEARPWRGMAMGLKVALIHVLSGTVVFLMLQVISEQSLGSPLQEVPGVQTASYAIVSVAGVYLFGRALMRRDRAAPTSSKGSAHQHRAGSLLSLGVGLLPCPLTVLVLTYAMANGTMMAGLALTGVMALGIATTIGLVGTLAVLARRYAIRWLDAEAIWTARFMRGVELVSAAFVLAFGLALLLGVLTPAARNPFST
jgi:nickel/cobalt transporter (NicO) family protein